MSIALLGVDDLANRSLPLVALAEAVVTQLAGDAADAWCFVTVDAQLLQRQRLALVTIYYLALHERFMLTQRPQCKSNVTGLNDFYKINRRFVATSDGVTKLVLVPLPHNTLLKCVT